MSKNPSPLELTLDEPGAMGARAVVWSPLLSAVTIIIAVIVIAYGDIQLPALPQFVPLHVAFVFLLDAITAFMLFGQFYYRRLPLYLILGSGYLFTATISIPFLLSFPAAIQTEGGIIGGSQSAIWLWHYWHILFPAFIAIALVLHSTLKGRTIEQDKLRLYTLTACGCVLILVTALTASVTTGHDLLPALIDVTRKPQLTTAFYWTGSAAAVITLIALSLAWYHGRRKIVLHLWLAVAMTAFLADVAASLGAASRYTVGWYFGRIEAIIAASVLLLVLLVEIMRIYQQLGRTINQLTNVNKRLVALVKKNKKVETELAEKNQELEYLSKTDHLTQLANRQCIEAHINELLESAHRYQRTFTVVMLDIDHFKRINDSFGHNVGDQVLRKLGTLIDQRIRATDIAGRWGGEEFLIVCSETDKEHARELAEDLRNHIQKTSFGPPIQVTASFGIAQYQHGDELKELIIRADQRLYRAKQEGRNRVVAS